ncbi:hypothetical protein J6524_19795 [Bradyrhizobium sp. WSM 1738]|uniref:hypothetical protein n=1 Tax=Bradyrhizobium hereditatis TaxID=2821405 RepID=UPI001CE2DE74|nr:hypothetical protein [Bradyrhizobium hereditatis]MCA6117098.1 hypothetical protein [Bradyrhizobium hereditatis]
MGPTGSDFVKSILARSSDPTSGATAVGIFTVLITASGVFGEMRTSLNATSRHGVVRSDLLYRVMPDTIHWRHLLLGAFVTALLFTIGQSLIGWYPGQAARTRPTALPVP